MTSELPIVVSGPPVVVTLLTGLLFAFAIQLLMTSFGVAAGVTAIGFLPSSPRSAESPSTESLSTEPASAESPSAEAAGGAVVGMIGFSVGLGMLLTVNFVLFVACFLAVKLSLAEDVAIGAILGLVIWAAYFLILVWLGSSAVGSLLGAIVTTLTAGAQGMIATIKTVFGRQAGDRDPPNAMQPQLDQLQRELETVRSVDRRTLEVQVQDYLQTLDLPKPDFQAIRDEFARVVSDLRGQPDLRGQDSHWPVEVAPFDRQLLIDRLSRHPAFSRQDVDQLVEQLEAVWHEVTEKPRSASDSSGVAPAAIDFRQRNTETAAATSSTATPTQAGRLQDVAKQVMHAVRQRVDWSELDAGTIVQNIQSAVQSNSSHDATRNSSQPDLGQPDLSKLDLVQADSVKADSVKADIEDFLLTAYPWHLTRKTVQIEFKDVIYDPDAEPLISRQQLLPLDRGFFVAVLHQRDDLTDKKIATIADRLEAVRQDVLAMLDQAASEPQGAQADHFSAQVADWLQSAKPSSLKPARLRKQWMRLLQTSGKPLAHWSEALNSLTPDVLLQMVEGTPDPDRLLKRLETARDRLLTELQDLPAQAKTAAAQVWANLEPFLRDRAQPLTAREIRRHLKALLKQTNLDLAVLRLYLPAFDAAVVQTWLRDREDLSEQRIRQIVQQLEKAWNSFALDVQPSASQTSSSQPLFEPAVAAIVDYIKQTDWSQVNASDVPQDLLKYLQQRDSTIAPFVQQQWDALLRQLNQQIDLAAQPQLQMALRALGRWPRRWARRHAVPQDLLTTLAEYVQQADWEDLTVSMLRSWLHRSALPIDQLRAIVSQVDRSTLRQWLGQRTDGHSDGTAVSHVERLLQQFAESVPEALADPVVEQATTALATAKADVESAIAGVSDRIAQRLEPFWDYLSRLDLPELNDDVIKQQLYQLLSEPQASFEALKENLSSLNRDALTAILSRRDDISATLADQLADRVDAARSTVLQQVEAMQQETKQRLDTLKQQANDTRKAIAIAAWWLFGIAITSALTAAAAGATAIDGFNWLLVFSF